MYEISESEEAPRDRLNKVLPQHADVSSSSAIFSASFVSLAAAFSASYLMIIFYVLVHTQRKADVNLLSQGKK